MQCHKVWKKQCQAARSVRRRFGLKNALDYLVSEKLLNFAEAAESTQSLRPSFRVFRLRCGASFTPMSLPVTLLFSVPRPEESCRDFSMFAVLRVEEN